ncbi:uncharacterized protein SCHCODRAFT_02113682 [Schizophyllum commune H4-8]|uniref:uncharacterized protein n=1 Tax=Schizophyllum commune (strain H4-8 / FGSC 9210) TaxID=578458 RepID=UPI00215EDBEF|nr:uncharacterized protein SCHCODRAFT_02113682 [Schizophyllum commune H4-8]KAI5886139.1 hypothetical protein SCHCODRAFT_02113682 [Schizophyllum commune H4-8]
MAPLSHTRGNFITNPRGGSLLLRGRRGRRCRIRRQSPTLPGSYCLPPAVLIVITRPSFYVLAPGIECIDCIGHRARTIVCRTPAHATYRPDRAAVLTWFGVLLIVFVPLRTRYALPSV